MCCTSVWSGIVEIQIMQDKLDGDYYFIFKMVIYFIFCYV